MLRGGKLFQKSDGSPPLRLDLRLERRSRQTEPRQERVFMMGAVFQGNALQGFPGDGGELRAVRLLPLLLRLAAAQQQQFPAVMQIQRTGKLLLALPGKTPVRPQIVPAGLVCVY